MKRPISTLIVFVALGSIGCRSGSPEPSTSVGSDGAVSGDTRPSSPRIDTGSAPDVSGATVSPEDARIGLSQPPDAQGEPTGNRLDALARDAQGADVSQVRDASPVVTNDAAPDASPTVDSVVASQDFSHDGNGIVDSPTDVAVGSPDSAPIALTPTAGFSVGSCNLKLSDIAPGEQDFVEPVFIAQGIRGGSLFVVERTGKVIRVDASKRVAQPFLDLSARISREQFNERGLLGFALHPQFAQDRRFFVSYSRGATDPSSMGQEGDLVVAEGKANTSFSQAESSFRSLSVTSHPDINLYGGMITFGPDGRLYAGHGDGGGGEDRFDNGQNKNVRLGKILRMDVDRADSAPLAGNASGADPLVWAIGVRNPWRFSFDRMTGDFLLADPGGTGSDEVDFLAAGSPPPNFGWSTTEGDACLKPRVGCSKVGQVTPVFTYDRIVSSSFRIAVVGGYVYRGTGVPCLKGRYVFGDYEMGRLLSMTVTSTQSSDRVDHTVQIGSTIGGLVSLGEDQDGELYVVSYKAGRVFKIQAR